jgi:hypothetical protein
MTTDLTWWYWPMDSTSGLDEYDWDRIVWG